MSKCIKCGNLFINNPPDGEVCHRCEIADLKAKLAKYEDIMKDYNIQDIAELDEFLAKYDFDEDEDGNIVSQVIVSDQKYIDIEYFSTIYKENQQLKQQLAEKEKEVKKEVVGDLIIDIRSLFNAYASSLINYCIWNKNADGNLKLYNNFRRIINDRLEKVLKLFDERIDRIQEETK